MHVEYWWSDTRRYQKCLARNVSLCCLHHRCRRLPGDYRLRSFSVRGQVVILSCRTDTLHHNLGFVDTRFTLRLGTWYFERFRRFLCPVFTQWIIQLRFAFLMFMIQLPVVTHSPAGNIGDTGCETTELRC